MNTWHLIARDRDSWALHLTGAKRARHVFIFKPYLEEIANWLQVGDTLAIHKKDGTVDRIYTYKPAFIKQV
jgi:hypothetical protein